MEEPERYIVRDLLDPSDMAVLVVPIDKAAPKGRLILPQQQTIRDILEADAVSVVVKETELKNVLGRFREKPKLVITDSQAFEKVAADTPDDILLTSFSILFARYKGDLASVVKGVTALDTVEDGDVILNYSMDKSIYFSTLNQYKYHPAIVISAEVGSEVRCAARGEVTDISVNEETGTTLTMDIGSGYQAIYGQLKEVTVEEGDTVESETVIGYVSEPTKYYTLEGSNLYFQLLKNREPVNPMDYME